MIVQHLSSINDPSTMLIMDLGNSLSVLSHFVVGLRRDPLCFLRIWLLDSMD
jgi:hypothetical protein